MTRFIFCLFDEFGFFEGASNYFVARLHYRSNLPTRLSTYVADCTYLLRVLGARTSTTMPLAGLFELALRVGISRYYMTWHHRD